MLTPMLTAHTEPVAIRGDEALGSNRECFQGGREYQSRDSRKKTGLVLRITGANESKVQNINICRQNFFYGTGSLIFN